MALGEWANYTFPFFVWFFFWFLNECCLIKSVGQFQQGIFLEKPPVKHNRSHTVIVVSSLSSQLVRAFILRYYPIYGVMIEYERKSELNLPFLFHIALFFIGQKCANIYWTCCKWLHFSVLFYHFVNPRRLVKFDYTQFPNSFIHNIFKIFIFWRFHFIAFSVCEWKLMETYQTKLGKKIWCNKIRYGMNQNIYRNWKLKTSQSKTLNML